jgi:hypothetical protein
MAYQDSFELSATLHKDKGYKLSPAECGFILAELDGLVEKYQKELDDKTTSPALKRMIQHHLEGLVYITENVRKGMKQ